MPEDNEDMRQISEDTRKLIRNMALDIVTWKGQFKEANENSPIGDRFRRGGWAAIDKLSIIYESKTGQIHHAYDGYHSIKIFYADVLVYSEVEGKLRKYQFHSDWQGALRLHHAELFKKD